jgi:hypothetical protein
MKLQRLIFTTILTISLIPAFSTEKQKPGGQREIIASIRVSSGELEVCKEKDYQFIVSLNGKPIHENHSYILGLNRFYMNLGGYSVVLLDEISGGNICQAFSFRFVAWKSDGAYSVSNSFGNCQGPVIRQDGEKLNLFFKGYIGEYSKKEYPDET